MKEKRENRHWILRARSFAAGRTLNQRRGLVTRSRAAGPERNRGRSPTVLSFPSSWLSRAPGSAGFFSSGLRYWAFRRWVLDDSRSPSIGRNVVSWTTRCAPLTRVGRRCYAVETIFESAELRAIMRDRENASFTIAFGTANAPFHGLHGAISEAGRPLRSRSPLGTLMEGERRWSNFSCSQ